MKSTNQFLIVFLILLSFSHAADAQITINGRSPRRYTVSGPNNSLSISYGYHVWVDGAQVSMPGYSEQKANYHQPGRSYTTESRNNAIGLVLGYERRVVDNFSLKGMFSTAKMNTGTASRPDLVTSDQSTFTQMGLYGKYTLNSDPYSRFQIQLIAGPEVLYANRRLVVEDYVSDKDEGPSDMSQIVSIVEGALVGGLGLSYQIKGKISLFTESLIGISLPGEGLKSTNTGLGVKFTW